MSRYYSLDKTKSAVKQALKAAEKLFKKKPIENEIVRITTNCQYLFFQI